MALPAQYALHNKRCPCSQALQAVMCSQSNCLKPSCSLASVNKQLCWAAQVSVLDAAAAAELLGVLRGAARQHADPIQVISAFQVPRVKYDPIRRTFHLAPERPPLLGVAQARCLPRCLQYRLQGEHSRSCLVQHVCQTCTLRSFMRKRWAAHHLHWQPLSTGALSGYVHRPSIHMVAHPCLTEGMHHMRTTAVARSGRDSRMHVSQHACVGMLRTRWTSRSVRTYASADTHAGRAQDKLDLYVQRLYVLQQRLRRMPMFTAPVYSKLRPVERDFCEARPAPAHPVPNPGCSTAVMRCSASCAPWNASSARRALHRRFCAKPD